MKFTHPEIDTLIDTSNGMYNTIVIENQDFMCRLLSDLYDQCESNDGKAVISENGTPVTFSKSAMLLDRFIPFEINKKMLVTRLTNALEQEANSAEHYEQTAGILRDIEIWLDDLAFRFPCDIIFSNISISALLKACAPSIRNTSSRVAEQVIDFMELIYEFDRQRLFFTMNMRSFVSDEEMELFSETAVSHGFHVIGIESFEHRRLKNEKRIIIDTDLCEIS